jgi:hypothetical protein
MSSRRQSRPLSKSKALARVTIFGPPPILPGEDEHAYEGLATQVTGAVKPTSIIEEIWIKDIVDLTWEIVRLRKLKTEFLSAQVPSVLKDIIKTSEDDARAMFQKWVRGWNRQLDGYLKYHNSTIDGVYSKALISNITDIQRLDEMIMLLERRRNSVFHEIDRHRTSLSRTLRDNVKQIEDAEFKEIDRETDSPNIAAEETPA